MLISVLFYAYNMVSKITEYAVPVPQSKGLPY